MMTTTTPMMMKTLLLSLLFWVSWPAAAHAKTTVAVLELGKGGTVRRTTSQDARATVAGVASFWSSLHGGIPASPSMLAHAGHTVVPDLFHKADSGVVVGLTGVDLSVMPTLTNLMEEEGIDQNRVVGHLELDGAFGRPLLNKIGIADEATSASSIPTLAHTKSHKKGLSAMRMHVDEETASSVDTHVGSLVKSLHKEALEQGRTVVLHLVVEEEEGAARRRLASRRRLEGEDGEGEGGEGEGEGEGEQGEGEQGEGGSADGTDGENGKSGYYGYGYYNSYGEWVTPYKTMFQIQYFNVVLWTALGLTAVLFFAIYMVIYMPLEADTLLFGESGKISAD